MPAIMDETGTYRPVSEEEYQQHMIALLGEETWRAISAPPKSEAELTEGEKYLLNKMQSEHEVNAAAAAAGYESIFDLPSEDDEEVDLDFGPPVGDAYDRVRAQLEFADQRLDKLRPRDDMGIDLALKHLDKAGREMPWPADQQRWLDSVVAYLKADEKA